MAENNNSFLYTRQNSHWDEMYDNTDGLRSTYEHFSNFMQSTSISELEKKEDLSRQLFLNQGVTFTVYNHGDGVEKIFPFDVIPRIIQFKEWQKMEAGIKQRLKALNLFIHDIYHDKNILKDGIIDKDMVLQSDYYLREMDGIDVPSDIYIHISGVDLIRHSDGEFYVLEDNLRTPSGVSYMLENREISRRIFPKLLSKSGVQPVNAYPNLLHSKLSALAVDEDKPNIVLLTPGIYNSAYYEHTALARLMGVQLVEGNDLLVKDHKVYMKTISGLERVHVIYRRVDDEFLDPLYFNPTSVLGVPGIMSAYAQGNVAIVNAPGTGVGDDKATYTKVPDMIRYYLNEEPLLKNIETFKLGVKEELEHVLKNIDQMVVKKTNGSGGYGMLMGSFASQKEIDEYVVEIKKDPKAYVAQPTIKLSTTPCLIDGKLQPRCVDLRPFALYGPDGIDITPGGLTRVALPEGSLVVNSSQGGGSKDTWILNE